MLTGAELYQPNVFVVFLNGSILGITHRAEKFVRDFRHMRRAGRVSEFVSIFINDHQKTINLSSDGGRICRPLIIVENRQPRVTQQHINVSKKKKTKKKKIHFDSIMISEGWMYSRLL
jgi:DNA-directed RNA polymerase III subunit RPC2